MLVGLTTVAVAACALLFPMADRVVVLTIKSLMSITSPAKVLSSFTRRKGFAKGTLEGFGKLNSMKELKLLIKSWL